MTMHRSIDDPSWGPGRKGFSLLEMLFVLSCLGLILVMLSGLMLSLNRALRDPDHLHSNYEAVYTFVPWVKNDLSRGIEAEILDETSGKGTDLILITLGEEEGIVYRETKTGLRRIFHPHGKEKTVLPAWLRVDFFVEKGGPLGRDLVKMQIRDRRTGETIFSSMFAAGG